MNSIINKYNPAQISSFYKSAVFPRTNSHVLDDEIILASKVYPIIKEFSSSVDNKIYNYKLHVLPTRVFYTGINSAGERVVTDTSNALLHMALFNHFSFDNITTEWINLISSITPTTFSSKAVFSAVLDQKLGNYTGKNHPQSFSDPLEKPVNNTDFISMLHDMMEHIPGVEEGFINMWAEIGQDIIPEIMTLVNIFDIPSVVEVPPQVLELAGASQGYFLPNSRVVETPIGEIPLHNGLPGGTRQLNLTTSAEQKTFDGMNIEYVPGSVSNHIQSLSQLVIVEDAIASSERSNFLGRVFGNITTTRDQFMMDGNFLAPIFSNNFILHAVEGGNNIWYDHPVFPVPTYLSTYTKVTPTAPFMSLSIYGTGASANAVFGQNRQYADAGFQSMGTLLKALGMLNMNGFDIQVNMMIPFVNMILVNYSLVTHTTSTSFRVNPLNYTTGYRPFIINDTGPNFVVSELIKDVDIRIVYVNDFVNHYNELLNDVPELNNSDITAFLFLPGLASGGFGQGSINTICWQIVAILGNVYSLARDVDIRSYWAANHAAQIVDIASWFFTNNYQNLIIISNAPPGSETNIRAAGANQDVWSPTLDSSFLYSDWFQENYQYLSQQSGLNDIAKLASMWGFSDVFTEALTWVNSATSLCRKVPVSTTDWNGAAANWNALTGLKLSANGNDIGLGTIHYMYDFSGTRFTYQVFGAQAPSFIGSTSLMLPAHGLSSTLVVSGLYANVLKVDVNPTVKLVLCWSDRCWLPEVLSSICALAQSYLAVSEAIWQTIGWNNPSGNTVRNHLVDNFSNYLMKFNNDAVGIKNFPFHIFKLRTPRAFVYIGGAHNLYIPSCIRSFAMQWMKNGMYYLLPSTNNFISWPIYATEEGLGYNVIGGENVTWNRLTIPGTVPNKLSIPIEAQRLINSSWQATDRPSQVTITLGRHTVGGYLPCFLGNNTNSSADRSVPMLYYDLIHSEIVYLSYTNYNLTTSGNLPLLIDYGGSPSYELSVNYSADASLEANSAVLDFKKEVEEKVIPEANDQVVDGIVELNDS
jgi:hypothetical protein